MVIMFTLSNIRDILEVMTLLASYFLIISPPGAFHAWVAKKMGDSTASDMGLNSLNPLVHVDIIGLICLFIFNFGWGRQIPVNPSLIAGKNRTAKLVIASFAGIPIYLIQAIVYIFLLAIIFGGTSQIFTNQQASSLALVARNILLFATMLSIFLAVIEFAFKGVMLLVTMLTEKNYIDSQHVWYTLLLVPILVLFVLGQPLQKILTALIFKVADYIALCFGII